MKQFGYTSPMQVPRLSKITLNMGVSEAVADKKVMDHAVSDLSKIAGQKPVVTKAKKAIAGFKIREEQAIGCMVGAPAWAHWAREVKKMAACQTEIGLHLDLTQYPLLLQPQPLGPLILRS